MAARWSSDGGLIVERSLFIIKDPEGLALPSARKAIQSVWQAGEARKIVSRNPICPGRRASDIEGEQKTGFAPLYNMKKEIRVEV